MRSACLLVLALGVLSATGQPPKQAAEAQKLVQTGIAAQQRKDWRAAIEAFKSALAIQPDQLDAHIHLGDSLAAIGDYDAAIEEDKRALALASDKSAVEMNLALAYYRKGDLNRARQEAETLHAANPLDVAAAVLLGYTYIKLGREAEAADLLTPLEAGHESNTDLEYVLGYALIQTGKQAEGLPRIEKVADITQSADAYAIAGSSRFYRQEYREAQIDIDAAIKLNPSLPGLHSMQGQIRYALGDTNSAIQSFQTALRSNPRDFNANLYLGIFQLKDGDLEGARPLLELALQLQPTSPLARLQVAKLNGMSGDTTAALNTLEELEKANPAWLDPHVELAVLYYKLHRTADGQREREIVKQIESQQQRAGPHNQ